MKKLLFIFSIFTALAASSQADTARQPIRLQLKVKHYLYIAGQLSNANTIADSRLKDSLSMGIGSGLQPDSASTITLRAGTVLRFVQNVSIQPGGQVYDYLDELITSTAAQGWRGLIVQLNTKIAAGGAEGKTATWLKAQILQLLQNFAAVQSAILETGKTFTKNVVADN